VLYEDGFRDIEYVRADLQASGRATAIHSRYHVWLSWHDLDVDITADQFAEFASFVVLPCSTWHASLQIVDRGFPMYGLKEWRVESAERRVKERQSTAAVRSWSPTTSCSKGGPAKRSAASCSASSTSTRCCGCRPASFTWRSPGPASLPRETRVCDYAGPTSRSSGPEPCLCSRCLTPSRPASSAATGWLLTPSAVRFITT
jgi:hypothetical protein